MLDYLGMDSAAVIATSAGGPIGMRLAIDYPNRVKSLILLNTGASLMSLTPTGVDPADPFVSDRLETVAKRLALLDVSESEGIDAVIADSEDEWRTPPQPTEPDPVFQSFRDNRQLGLDNLSPSELARLALGALLNMKAQRGVDLSADMTRIMCPVLIVHGDADTTVPIAFSCALADRIAQAELSVLNGDGHGLIVNPAAQQVVTHWLQSV